MAAFFIHAANDANASAISKFLRVGWSIGIASGSLAYRARGYFDGANEPGGNSTSVLPSLYSRELFS